jgi:hypothetical protein
VQKDNSFQDTQPGGKYTPVRASLDIFRLKFYYIIFFIILSRVRPVTFFFANRLSLWYDGAEESGLPGRMPRRQPPYSDKGRYDP